MSDNYNYGRLNIEPLLVVILVCVVCYIMYLTGCL